MILTVRRNRFRNMKIEGNLGDRYCGMRKFTALKGKKNSKIQATELKKASLNKLRELVSNISWGTSSE